MQTPDIIYDIAQSDNLLFIIILIIISVAIDRYLLHRRLMKKLNHETRTSKEVNLDISSFPTIDTGLLLAGIGISIWCGFSIGPMLTIIGILLIIGKAFRPISSSIYDRFRDCIEKDDADG